MNALLLALALVTQCSGGQCGQFGRPAFTFAPLPVAQAPAPALAEYRVTLPSGATATVKGWRNADGTIGYWPAQNTHLNQTASPPAAAGPVTPAPVGATGPSLLDLASDLHTLKQAVDDLKALKPAVAPKPEHFAGDSRAKRWLEGYCDRCSADHQACAKTPGGPGCQCVGCECPEPRPTPKAEEPPPKCDTCATPCPKTGGECECDVCLCPMADKPKAEAALPTMPELPRMFAAVSDSGQPITQESHAPTKVCDADGSVCYSYGVNHDEIAPPGPVPRVTTNPHPSDDTREMVATLLAPEGSYGAGQKDDSDQPYLTVIGDEAQRKQVESDLTNDPDVSAEFKDSFRLNSYPKDFWWVTEHNLGNGSPTLLLQDRHGKVLWRQHDYTGGKWRLLRHLRSAKHGIQEAMWLIWLRERIEEEVDLPAIGVIVGGLVVLFVLASPRKKP